MQLFKTMKKTLYQHYKSFLEPKLGRHRLHPPKQMFIPTWYQHKVQINSPILSIVTPSFNHGSYIERTIQSVVNQAYPNLEYIVQDGGSKDETIEILQRYHTKLFRWESVKDTGQSNAINKGFQHATGGIMAYLNSDDLLTPGTLHYVANYFNQHPKVDVVYGHRILIDENDYEIGRWVLPPHDSEVMTWMDFIPQETLFWRRAIWDKVGGIIDENFQYAMDWDLILRFIKANATFTRLPRFLGAFRVHPAQKTSAQYAQTGEKEIRHLLKRMHGRKVSHDEIKKNTQTYLFRHAILDKLYQAGFLKY